MISNHELRFKGRFSANSLRIKREIGIMMMISLFGQADKSDCSAFQIKYHWCIPVFDTVVQKDILNENSTRKNLRLVASKSLPGTLHLARLGFTKNQKFFVNKEPNPEKRKSEFGLQLHFLIQNNSEIFRHSRRFVVIHSE